MTYSLRRLEKAHKGALLLLLCHFCCKTRLKLMLSIENNLAGEKSSCWWHCKTLHFEGNKEGALHAWTHFYCRAAFRGCPNAFRLGTNMLDVLKWFKDGGNLTSDLYTNLYVAEGTGEVTKTAGAVTTNCAWLKKIICCQGPPAAQSCISAYSRMSQRILTSSTVAILTPGCESSCEATLMVCLMVLQPKRRKRAHMPQVLTGVQPWLTSEQQHMCQQL